MRREDAFVVAAVAGTDIRQCLYPLLDRGNTVIRAKWPRHGIYISIGVFIQVRASGWQSPGGFVRIDGVLSPTRNESPKIRKGLAEQRMTRLVMDDGNDDPPSTVVRHEEMSLKSHGNRFIEFSRPASTFPNAERFSFNLQNTVGSHGEFLERD